MPGERCSYEVRRDAPEQWHGESEGDWLLDQQPIWATAERDREPEELDTWHCPHEAIDREETSGDPLCIFHTSPEEVPEELDETTAFVDAINSAGPVDEPEATRPTSEFVGATFGPLELDDDTSLQPNEQLPIRLTYAQFTGPVDFSTVTFDAPLDARRIRVTGRGAVDLSSATFEDCPGVSFREASFSNAGRIYLLATNFGTGPVSFRGADFSSTTDLAAVDSERKLPGHREEARVLAGFDLHGDGDLTFEGATFDCTGNIEFRETSVRTEGEITFADATFAGTDDVNFGWTTLVGDTRVSFQDLSVECNGTVSYTNATLRSEADVLFTGASLKAEGTLDWTRIAATAGGRLSFDDVQFVSDGDVRFDNAELSASRIQFSDTRFDGESIRFRNCQFTGAGDVSFRGATFENRDEVWFSGSEFTNAADVRFEAATFENLDHVQFRETVFENDGTLRFGSFSQRGKDPAQFTNAGDVVFSAAHFECGDDVDFPGVEFACDGAVNFDETRFTGDGSVSFGAQYDAIAAEFTNGGVVSFVDARFRDLDGVYFSHVGVESSGPVQFDAVTFDSVGRFSLADVRLRDPGQVSFTESDLTGVTLDFVPSGMGFRRADFSEQNLEATDFSGADLEQARFSRANLSGADFYGAELDGTLFGSAHIDETTSFISFHKEESARGNRVRADPMFEGDPESRRRRLWAAIRAYLPLRPVQASQMATGENERSEASGSRDDIVEETDQSAAGNSERYRKAARTYHTIEKVARENSLPGLQARAFVRRQDMHWKRYAEEATTAPGLALRLWGRWVRASIARLTLLYGESPWRILAAALFVIVLGGLIYPLGGIKSATAGGAAQPATIPEYLSLLPDALYFSTLTFTTLGFGGFEPIGWGRWIATAETGLGASLIALLVFVLGRRAAR
jgi:uncharacterized protein YjbI with pentapeptide repeats